MTVKELITKFGFDVDQKALEDLESGIEGVKHGLLGLTVSVGAAAFGLFEVVKHSAEAAQHIKDTAAAAGVSQQALQRLGFAAKLNGSNIDELSFGLRFLGRNLYEAAQTPASDTAKEFRKLGISVKDANGKIRSADSVFLDLSDRMRKIQSPTERAAIAMKLLGRGGGGLAQMLARGRAEITAAGDEFASFGGLLDGKTIEMLSAFNDNLDRLKAILGAVVTSIGVGLTPAMDDIVKGMIKFLKANRDLIKTNVTGFLKGLTFYLRKSWQVALYLGEAIAGLTHLFGGAETATKIFLGTIGILSGVSLLFGIGKVATAIYEIVAALTLADLAAVAIPAAIGAAIVLLLIALEDVYSYFTGKNSITGKILDGFGSVETYLRDKFVKAIEFVQEKIDGIIPEWMRNFLGGFAFPGLAGAAQTGSVTGISPVQAVSSAPGSVKNQNSTDMKNEFNFNFPPGTDPTKAGDNIAGSVTDRLDALLRQTHRAAFSGGY